MEPGDRVVELAGDALLVARRVLARPRARHLLDLAGDRIEPLVNVSDLLAVAADRRHAARRLAAAKIRRGRCAERGVDPVVQRHAGALRRGLGPFTDGRVDAFITPRYARIHVSSGSASSAPTKRLQPPHASRTEHERKPRRSPATGPDF